MILEYHRPKTLDEALILLARKQPLTIPLGGGSVINRPSRHSFAVVDLQALGLDGFDKRGHTFFLGSTLTLQTFLSKIRDSDEYLWLSDLEKAILQEAPYNLRNKATIAGTLISADGHSPLTTCFLALDASLGLQPGEEEVDLGDLLPFRKERLVGRLVDQIKIPGNVRLVYESVARTPVDRPLVCAALATWPSGRTRLALGGFGNSPSLVIDGSEASGIETAARGVYADAGDEWASADYRAEMAVVLSRRCLKRIESS
jgi:CO/xanthine dehydrogenase FAD-binding subunit